MRGHRAAPAPGWERPVQSRTQPIRGPAQRLGDPCRLAESLGRAAERRTAVRPQPAVCLPDTFRQERHPEPQTVEPGPRLREPAADEIEPERLLGQRLRRLFGNGWFAAEIEGGHAGASLPESVSEYFGCNPFVLGDLTVTYECNPARVMQLGHPPGCWRSGETRVGDGGSGRYRGSATEAPVDIEGRRRKLRSISGVGGGGSDRISGVGGGGSDRYRGSAAGAPVDIEVRRRGSGRYRGSASEAPVDIEVRRRRLRSITRVGVGSSGRYRGSATEAPVDIGGRRRKLRSISGVGGRSSGRYRGSAAEAPVDNEGRRRKLRSISGIGGGGPDVAPAPRDRASVDSAGHGSSAAGPVRPSWRRGSVSIRTT